jgi:hypothetical protein
LSSRGGIWKTLPKVPSWKGGLTYCERFLISKQGWNFDTYCCLLRLLYLPEDGENTKELPFEKAGYCV